MEKQTTGRRMLHLKKKQKTNKKTKLGVVNVSKGTVPIKLFDAKSRYVYVKLVTRLKIESFFVC